MSKFQKVSNNSLEELMCLMADIQSRIEDIMSRTTSAVQKNSLTVIARLH